MESATIAAQGYRFRVPYGTLLCVSDKPLHGEIKLPGRANRFMKALFPNTCKLAFGRSICCAQKATDCIHVNYEPLMSRRSDNKL